MELWYEGRLVGYIMENIVVSPGHRVRIGDVPHIVSKFRCKHRSKHKLPEPLYLSHKLASEIRNIIRILYGKGFTFNSEES